MKVRTFTLCILLSSTNLFAANWQTDEGGIFNDFFNIDIDYASVDASSGTTREAFNQSVGNVIDYWQDLLGNHTPSERINVHIEFTNTGSLGTASTTFNSNVEITGKPNFTNNTFTLSNYTPYETSYGLQYNHIANAQAKLQGYAANTSAAYDMTIDFTDFSVLNASSDKTYSYHYGAAEDIGVYNFDFETVLLHEITHGMGMTGTKFQNVEGGTTTTLQHRRVTYDGVTWLDMRSPDGDPIYFETAWDALLSVNMNDVLDYQPGALINIEAGDRIIPIFNPNPFDAGSSLAHPLESEELRYVMGYLTTNYETQRQFHENELYLLEALGYDIAGISLNVPEPSSATLSLFALSALLLHRRRKKQLI